MNDVINKANELAALLADSAEYKSYCNAKANVCEDASTWALLKEYRSLQYKVQAALLSSGESPEDMMRLQKLGELLQLNPAASEYLFAQYRLSALLGDVYKTLAVAVDADLGVLGD